MTDPSRDDPPTGNPPTGNPPAGSSSTGDPSTGNPSTSNPPSDHPSDATSGGKTPRDNLNDRSDAVDPAHGSDDGRSTDSPAIAIAVAVALGMLGPFIALIGGVGVFAVGAVMELSLAARLVLTLFVGQYVAFAGLALVYLAWRGLDRSGIVSYLGVRRPSLTELGIVVGGWVVILILVVIISTVLRLVGAETASNQSAEVALANPAIVPLFIAASFLVIGPCEEILYRGVVQGRLRESLPAVPAIAIASAIFAFIHVMALTGGVTGRLTTVAILFFPSLVFGAVYEYTENIVVPSLLHGLHNAVIFTLLYVTVVYGDEFEDLAEGGALLLPL